MTRFPSVLQTILIAGFALAVAGCEVGPDYQPPQSDLPAAWISGDAAQDSKEAIDQQWWANFHDPVLTQLIDKAAAGNLDLKAAEARIAQARAVVAANGASLFPTGDLKGSATREANQFALPDANSSGFGPLLHKPFNIFQTGFDANWELDLFGGEKRGEEAANAQLEASEASRDDARVSLMAEVARTYIDIRQYQAQIAIATDTLASDQKSLDIARQRFKAGDAPGIDVTQAESAIEQARTQLPLNRNLLAQAEYSMDVLTGSQPGAAHTLVAAPTAIPVADKKLVLAAPAAVIAQRPDIRVAERKLAAATAQQGVAVAKFFPDLSLNGFFGAMNTSLTNLVTPANQSWIAGASVVWPIFNYGTLSANMDNADAQQQEAMANYQKTILGALSDVERSFTAWREQQQFLQSVAAAADKDRQARAVALERYRSGLTSFIDVLDADRTLFASQQRLVKARADASQDMIAVYKSLGGGWVKPDVKS